MSKKNSPAARQWQLVKLLQTTQQGLTIADMTKRLHCDTRTVFRDLAVLKHLGMPIKTKNQAHGLKLWRIDGNPLMIPAFGHDEAAAFYLGAKLLAPLSNTFIGDAAKEGLKKIENQLGTTSLQFLDKLLDVFRNSAPGWNDYPMQREVIETLITACEDRNETLIRYQSYEAQEEQEYRIHPYALIVQAGTLYLVGYSCPREAIRTWKVNRISSAERQETKYRKPRGFDIDEHRRKGFGVFVFNDKPVQKVRIKVDGAMARYVQEHHWHETQQFKQQSDGSVIVRFDVVLPTRELTNWILKLGSDAEVLSPKVLRREVAEEITKMHKKYRNR